MTTTDRTREQWSAIFVQSIIERITVPQGQVYVGPNYSTVDLLKDLLKLRDHFLDVGDLAKQQPK